MTNVMSFEAAVFGLAWVSDWSTGLLVRPGTARIFGASAHKTYTSAQGYPPRGLPPA